MKKLLRTFVLACLAMVSLSLHAQVNREENRQRFIEEINGLKQQLPLELPFGKLTNVYFEDQLLFLEHEVSQDLVTFFTEMFSLASDPTSSDRFFATSINGMSKEMLSFILNDVEIMKWIFFSDSTHEKIGEYTFAQSQVKKTVQQLSNGEIKPYTPNELMALFIRNQVIKEFNELKQELSFPLQIAEEMMVTDFFLHGDTLIFNYEVFEPYAQKEKLDKLSSGVEVAMSIADVGFDAFFEIGFVIKYVYYLEGGKEKLREIIITEDKYQKLLKKLQKIQNKNKNKGSLLEEMCAEIEGQEFPIYMDEGVYLSEVYPEGTSMYYVFTRDIEVAEDVYDFAEREELKREMAEGLAKEFADEEERIFKEDIHFVYIWRDVRNKTYLHIDFAPQDIFPAKEKKLKKTKR